jgi:energy-converting hydrogenase A subunit M
MLKIKSACKEYDAQNAIAYLDEIESYSFNETISETLDAISEKILHSDFEEAEILCESIIK